VETEWHNLECIQHADKINFWNIFQDLKWHLAFILQNLIFCTVFLIDELVLNYTCAEKHTCSLIIIYNKVSEMWYFLCDWFCKCIFYILSSYKTIIHPFPSLNNEIEDPVAFTQHYFHTKFRMWYKTKLRVNLLHQDPETDWLCLLMILDLSSARSSSFLLCYMTLEII
jgi:hypothetical protein